jgi:peptidoglycan/LPS O-acetylase OafA/YrhL
LRLPFTLDRQDFRVPGAASVALDGCRGLAALAVMLFHLRHLFFVEDPADANAVQWVAYKLTSPSASHLAVMVFFVMSGYLIGSAIFRARAEGRWSLSDYGIARLTRLWVVLLPALLLGGILDQAGQRLFADSGVYEGLPSDFAVLNLATPEPHFAIQSLVANALFLQDTNVGEWVGITRFGSNGPLWSLAYEFSYYALFPALLIVAWSRTWWVRLAALCFAIGIALGVGGIIVTYFSIWLFGAAIAWLPRPRFTSAALYRLTATLATAVTAVVLIAAILPAEPRFRWDFIAGAFFAAWIYVIASAPLAPRPVEVQLKREGVPALKFVADFSFSLYVLHMPLLVFLHAWVYEMEGAKWQPDLAHAAIALVIAAGVILYALAVASVTEFHTDEVRRSVRRRLDRLRSRRRADNGAVAASRASSS